MQWLTAILAFATTMLIFSMIVSTIVEIIHRVSGSRSFGLIQILEHLYDDVLWPYLTKGEEEVSRRQFVDQMIRIRPSHRATPGNNVGASDDSTPPTMLLKSWNMLPHLPVEMFMERLGASEFSTVLEKKVGEGLEERDEVLKNIAQKFELYGQEAGIYFDRKARSSSVAVAMLVAWVFYVHPYELIHTYLQQPAVAVAVADLREDALHHFEEIEGLLTEAANPETPASDDTLKTIQAALADAKDELAPLEAAGTPIGWSRDNGVCYRDLLDQSEQEAVTTGDMRNGNSCWIYVPREASDIIWLVMGGLLIGLGAPFWAKAVRQVTEIRSVSDNVAQILKPETQASSIIAREVAATDAELPITTKAFNASAAGQKRV